MSRMMGKLHQPRDRGRPDEEGVAGSVGRDFFQHFNSQHSVHIPGTYIPFLGYGQQSVSSVFLYWYDSYTRRVYVNSTLRPVILETLLCTLLNKGTVRQYSETFNVAVVYLTLAVGKQLKN